MSVLGLALFLCGSVTPHLQPCVDLQEEELLGVLINQELNSAGRPEHTHKLTLCDTTSRQHVN